MEPNSRRQYAWDGKDTNASNSSAYFTSRPEAPATRKINEMRGSLEIIEGSDSRMCSSSLDSPSNSHPPSSIRSWSRSSVGSVPPRPDSSTSRRVTTPTKQVTLQSVRRKEENSEPFVDHVDWRSVSLESSHRKTWEKAEAGAERELSLLSLESFSQNSDAEHATRLRLPQPDRTKEEQEFQQKQHPSDTRANKEKEIGGDQKRKTDENHKDDDGDVDDDDDGDSDSSEEEEEEPRKAPNELLMEFVDCLMKKDFQNASKLCKMILLYEPENAEALKFQPLIEEKLQLDAEAAEDSNEDDDEDSDDEDDSDDDDDSSSEEDSDEDDEEEEDGPGPSNHLHARYNAQNNDPNQHPLRRQDSGIASETEN